LPFPRCWRADAPAPPWRRCAGSCYRGKTSRPAATGGGAASTPGEETPSRDAADGIDRGRTGARRLPILAICRCIQILKRRPRRHALSGFGHRKAGPRTPQRRTAVIPSTSKAGSLPSETWGTRAASVNSRHHQAIRDLAPGLTAVAWADDGVIEGPNHRREGAVDGSPCNGTRGSDRTGAVRRLRAGRGMTAALHAFPSAEWGRRRTGCSDQRQRRIPHASTD